MLRPNASQLVVRLLHEASGAEHWAHLQGGWLDTLAAPGDSANVILDGNWTPSADGSSCAQITDASGLFILHPDVLVSGRRLSWPQHGRSRLLCTVSACAAPDVSTLKGSAQDSHHVSARAAGVSADAMPHPQAPASLAA